MIEQKNIYWTIFW